MVNWEQIVPLTIVAGVVGFLLTTTLNEYNQPKIQTELVTGNKTKGQPEWDYYINIKNAGAQPATGVRTTLHFINGYIKQYRIIFSSENATFLKQAEPDKVVIDSSRLSPYGSIYVYTRVTDVKRPLFVGNGSRVSYSGALVHFAGQYMISSSYKEGGSPFSVSSNLTSSNQTLSDFYGKYTPLHETVPFSRQVIQYVLVVAVLVGLFVGGFLFYSGKRKMSLEKNIEKVYNDLLFLNKKLETNPSDGGIFEEIEKWPRIKFYKLFGANAADILLIQKVLRKLQYRNQNIPDDLLSLCSINHECLDLVNEAIAGIDWKKYERQRANKITIVVTVVIEFSAFLLFLYTFGILKIY